MSQRGNRGELGMRAWVHQDSVVLPTEMMLEVLPASQTENRR